MSSMWFNYILSAFFICNVRGFNGFNVYWNIPTFMCRQYNISLDDDVARQFGILQNQNDSFRGDQFAILYDPGNFPAILQNTTSKKFVYRNDGVPQEGNLFNHLQMFEAHVNELIPDTNFTGIAVIDFESWRPIYRQNFGTLLPYKELSIKIERSEHPRWPDKRLEKLARSRFEEAAKVFMLETIMLGKKLRPNAKWGYYAFPYCFNGKNLNADNCANAVDKENNAIQWLFEASDAIFPSVYLQESLPVSNRLPMVRGRVKEAIRVANQVKLKPKPIVLVYHRYVYTDTRRYLGEIETYSVLHEIRKLGADGIILWGSSSDLNSKSKCEYFYEYLTHTLGPVVNSLHPVFTVSGSILENEST